jgi:hypothetical protein
VGDDVSIAAAPEAAAAPPENEPASRVADRLATVSGVIIAGVVLVGLVVLLAAVKRGLDLTDESDYIQSELHAGAYLRSSTQFQLLIGPVLSLVRYVWLVRAVKVIGLVAAHGFFAWSFVVTAPSLIGARFKRADRIAVVAAITSGAFGVSRVQAQTPGYNDLTVFIVVAVSGLLLLLADRRLSRRAEPAAWFVVGLVIWFQLLARWPSTAAIVPLTAIAFFWTGPKLAQLLRRAGAALAGIAVGALATQLFLAPVPDIIRGIHQGNTDASAALGYNRGHLLHQYVTNLSDLLRVMSHSFWFLLVAAVATGLLLGVRRYTRAVAIVAAVGLVLLTPAFMLSGRAHGGVEPFGGIGLPLLLARSVLIPLYVVLAVLAGGAAWIIRRDTRPTVRGLAVLAALLAAPFLGGLGSNNPLWYSAALDPGLWIAAALALCALTHREHGRFLVHGLAFALAGLIAFTAFDGTWHHPYRQAPLAADTVNVGVSGPLNGLSTDPNLASFLDQVRSAAEPVLSSKPNVIVWTPGLPGASVVTGLDQPLFAWLSADYFGELSLSAACNDHARGILLLQSPSRPALIASDPTLASACAGRSWTQRGSTSAGLLQADDGLPEGLAVWYAPPF